MSFKIQQTLFRKRMRLFIDRFSGYGIALGGISIILAVALIFFYLLWVVLPIFSPANVEVINNYTLPGQEFGETVYLSLEETGEYGVRITDQANAIFFTKDEGVEKENMPIQLPEDITIRKVIPVDSEGKLLAVLLSNNDILMISFKYRVTFENDIKLLIPRIEYPYGEEAFHLQQHITNVDTPIADLQVMYDEELIVFAAMTEAGKVIIEQYDIEEGDEFEEPSEQSLIQLDKPVDYFLLDSQAEWLYTLNQKGRLSYFSIRDKENPKLSGELQLIESEATLTDVRLLLGGISLLVADTKGRIRQWFLLRPQVPSFPGDFPYPHLRNKLINDLQPVFVVAREFNSAKPLSIIVPEARRKGLISLSNTGDVSIYHTTAERNVFNGNLFTLDDEVINTNSQIAYYGFSPRSDALVLQTDDAQLHVYSIDNHYPEISWQSLWGKVWYESYQEPEYIWQSSAADNDFEPKFSLIPLSFGTLKAAFYAMLFAMPLAIMGAIFTAYFMAPRMRSWVKPSIETMEALPTVILGFIAGLWLAPVVENNLLAVMSLLIILPVGLFFVAWLWSVMPNAISRLVPDGWQAALLMPVVVLLVWFAFIVAPGVEILFFEGDIQAFLKNNFDIDYDQRNSIVVGLAMGLAVIPTIFSITEDAIFSVPRHLSYGSLALGATPWQTLRKVVLLTASPGIFSAVMIGFGRAVGETMIVLMATGNTPVMDFSIFQGMRTLSANIAVELPESEVGSSHFRILFLAGLVLFALTFILNTLAEVVRQRLRRKYSSL